MISRKSILTAATLIMLGNLASRMLGLVRETVIAGLFGASGSTSAFGAAQTVPNMIFDLLIGGALSAALIPVFSDYANRDQDDELWSLVSTVMFIGGLALVSMAGLLMVFAGPLMGFLAEGLEPTDQEQAVTMVRIVLPAVVLLGLSGITTALLYSRQVFVFPAFCMAVYNLGIIVCAVLFAGVLDTTSLVVGIIVGSALQFVLQVPGLRQIGFSFRLNFHHPALRRILVLYAPVGVGLIVSQIGILFDRNFASLTGSDSIAVMRFATQIIQFPVGLVGTAISMAILPALSRHANEVSESLTEVNSGCREGEAISHDPMHSFKSTLVMGMRLALLLMIPAAVGLVILRVPVIQLLYQHGMFSPQDTEQTALAFLVYAPQLPFLPIDYLLIFAFYARKNTMTPVLVGIFTVLVYFAVALSLRGPLGMVGLCLANAAQNSLHAVVLFLLLLRTMGSLRGFALGSTVAKSVLATAVMGAALFVSLPPLQASVDMNTSLGQGIVIVAGALIGCVVYAAIVTMLKVEEVETFKGVVLRRLSAAR